MNSIFNLSAKKFIQQVFIKEIQKLIESKSYHIAFLAMAQALEVLGSFLDSKPLKARDQSKIRFSRAINRLMPVKYSRINDNHVLYDQLRASMAHSFTASRHIFLCSQSNTEYGQKHLQKQNDKLILVAEAFYSDFKKACLRLLDGMEKGIVPEKKINIEFYYTF